MSYRNQNCLIFCLPAVGDQIISSTKLVCQVSGKPVGKNGTVRSFNFTPTGFLSQNRIESNDIKMMDYEAATAYMISFVNLQHAYRFWLKSADRNTFFNFFVKS